MVNPIYPQTHIQESPGQALGSRVDQDAVGFNEKKGVVLPGGFAKLLQNLLSSSKGDGAVDLPPPTQAGVEEKVGKSTAGTPAGPAQAATPKPGEMVTDPLAKRPGKKGTAESRPTGVDIPVVEDKAERPGEIPSNPAKDTESLSVLKIPGPTLPKAGDSSVDQSKTLGHSPVVKGDAKALVRRVGPDAPNLDLAAAEAGRQVLSATRAFGAGTKAESLRSGDRGESDHRSEGVQRDRRKDRLELEVYDLRSRGVENVPTAKGLESPHPEIEGPIPETELVVDIRSGSGDRTSGGGEESTAKTSGFQDALARELREVANAEIVRHASLVLKDGGEGLIRLNLKPENLGSVKIRLEMAENKIAGSIIVESEGALRAFEKEIRSLEQAFVDGGFEGASLELSVATDGAGNRGNRDEWEGPTSFYSGRLVAADYDDFTTDVQAARSYVYGGTESAVDLLA